MSEHEDSSPMGRSVAGRLSVIDGGALWAAGLSVGWLTGLSVSEILATVLTAVLGVLVGAVTTIRSLRRQRGGARALVRLPLAVPVACMMIGIATGAPLGVVARTHGWFDAPVPTREASKDTRRASPATTTEPAQASQIPVQPPPQKQGVLFGIDKGECTELMILARSDVDSLRRDLKRSPNMELQEIERRVSDPEKLRATVTALCSAQPQ